MALSGTAVREFSEPSRRANCSAEADSAATGPVVLPFTKVPRQALEEESGGGGVTAQTGRVQQDAAQRSPGKVGSVHGRWDLRGSPSRSASGYTVFIIRGSISSNVLSSPKVHYSLDRPFPVGDIPPVNNENAPE